MLAKAGQLNVNVLDMIHAEAIVWLDDVGKSLGLNMSKKEIKEGDIIISRRLIKPKENIEENTND